MVSLIEVTEDNYRMVCGLRVAGEQAEFVAEPTRILASAYAMRNRNARCFAIANDGMIIGVLMVKDLFEEPACYTLEQFLIDYRYQNMGFGKQALKLIVDILREERKYGNIEICVKMMNIQAIRMYKSAGFVDTGYIDPNNPDSYVLRYAFA